MATHNKCKECANFLPIEGTVYGRCKVRPIARNQGGRLNGKEFITSRGKYACTVDFVKADKIPEVVRVCKRCGKEFTVTDNSRRVFCCDECRERWHIEQKSRERKAIKEEKASAKRVKSSRKKKVLSISEICKLAMEEHLSYGQYVERYGL